MKTKIIWSGQEYEMQWFDAKDFLKYCPWKESGKIQRDRAVEKIGELI